MNMSRKDLKLFVLSFITVNATVHIAQLQPPSAIVRVGTSLQVTCITTVDVAVKWNTNASGIDLNRLNTVIMHNGSGYYHQKTINNIQKELNFTSVCCSYNSGHTKSNVLILKVFDHVGPVTDLIVLYAVEENLPIFLCWSAPWSYVPITEYMLQICSRDNKCHAGRTVAKSEKSCYELNTFKGINYIEANQSSISVATITKELGIGQNSTPIVTPMLIYSAIPNYKRKRVTLTKLEINLIYGLSDLGKSKLLFYLSKDAFLVLQDCESNYRPSPSIQYVPLPKSQSCIIFRMQEVMWLLTGSYSFIMSKEINISSNCNNNFTEPQLHEDSSSTNYQTTATIIIGSAFGSFTLCLIAISLATCLYLYKKLKAISSKQLMQDPVINQSSNEYQLQETNVYDQLNNSSGQKIYEEIEDKCGYMVMQGAAARDSVGVQSSLVGLKNANPKKFQN